MGSGAHLLVVGAEPQDEQRLRKAVRNERSVHPRGDDTSDGEASGTQMRLFRRFRTDYSRKPSFRYTGFSERSASLWSLSRIPSSQPISPATPAPQTAPQSTICLATSFHHAA